MVQSLTSKPNRHILLWILGFSPVICFSVFLIVFLVTENARFVMGGHTRPEVVRALSVNYATPMVDALGFDSFREGVVVGVISSEQARQVITQSGPFKDCNRSACSTLTNDQVMRLSRLSQYTGAYLKSHGQKNESQDSKLAWSALHDHPRCFVKYTRPRPAVETGNHAICVSMSTGAYVYVFAEDY